MVFIQVLLPTTLPTGPASQDARAALADVPCEFGEAFDGLTVYVRSPCQRCMDRTRPLTMQDDVVKNQAAAERCRGLGADVTVVGTVLASTDGASINSALRRGRLMRFCQRRTRGWHGFLDQDFGGTACHRHEYHWDHLHRKRSTAERRWRTQLCSEA